VHDDTNLRSGEKRYRHHRSLDWDEVHTGTHCVDCYPVNCPLRVFVKNGRVVREELAANLDTVEAGVPDFNPMGCQKGLAWSRQHYNDDRPIHPLRRVGERGSGRWERITWDEALDEIADAIIDAIEDAGPESVVHEGSPEIGAVVPSVRFMDMIGGTTLDVNGSINDFWPGAHQTLGKFYTSSSVDDVFHADTIIFWHSNPAYTMQPSFHFATEARYRGAELVLIAPDVSPSHSHMDFMIPIVPGTDAALALAMCQVVVEEGLADWDFARSQTDLSLLARCDTGEFLRDAAGDGFFHYDLTDQAIVPASKATLDLDYEAALEGEWDAALADGTPVRVEPVFARLRRILDTGYTPETVAATCGTHPDTIRTLARKIAGGRTRIMNGAGLTKYFHGDLMTRAMLLLLALTGNWGRKGTGFTGWATGLFDGHTVGMTKRQHGVEGAEAVIGLMEGMRDALQASRPDLTPELASIEMWRALGTMQTSMVPPAFFWYWHAGYRERWNRTDWGDPTMPTDFDTLVEEALASGWPNMANRIGPDRPPRVLLEIAGNMLRRSRGGQELLLSELWPKLDLIVCVDFRMSQTALYSDIVLPATQSYEKTTFSMPTPWTMFLAMTTKAAEPPGEARSEWEILASLLERITERAAARGLERFTDAGGTVRSYGSLWSDFTLGGHLVDDESVAREMISDAVHAGTLAPESTFESIAAKGWTRYEDWGLMTMAQGQASPFPKGETHTALRNHIELGHPYPTLTRRAQFLIDHPWFVAAGEDLPCHKAPPKMGGDRPFALSSGHNRWSVHAMNMTNDVLLGTHRGKPFVVVHPDDAEALGISDDAVVRIHNDAGEFRVAARTTPTQRPGCLTVYNGFEGFMFPGGKGANEVEPGLVKWLHFATGYGHLTYTPTEWQPTAVDRVVYVDIEPVRSGG